MPDIWGLSSIVAKFALYMGILGSTGGVTILLVFRDLVKPVNFETKQMVKGFAILALLATAASFLFRGATLTGDATGLYDREIVGLLWQTAAGTTLIVRFCAMALMLTGLYLPRFGLWLSLFGGLIALWSFSQIGHIPDREIIYLRILLFLHLFGIAFWIGILFPLKWLCKDDVLHNSAMQVGHLFGKIAIFVVPALLAAGAVMAWVLLGDIWLVFSTGYGQLLLGKIALVAVLLTLAALNKLRFVPAMHNGERAAAQHLGQAINIEWMVVLVILAATAVLTSALNLP